RTSKEKVRFSSLMFLLPSPPRITRRSRLEHILLLLLRCAVICLLSLAFARPFLPRQLFDPPADVSPSKTIVLLDTSASMRRDNIWADAVARVDALGKETSAADQLALFTFDENVAPVLGFEEWTRTRVETRAALLRERLSTLKPKWNSDLLDTALMRAAEELQADEQKQPARQQIVVVSDLQEGSRVERLQSFEWPKNIQVRLERIKPRRTSNAGLHFVMEREPASTMASNPRVRVSNSRESSVEQFEIAWAGPIQPSPSNATVKAYVPPGQTRVVQATTPPTNSEGSVLVLSGDDVDFDNKV